MNGLIFRRTVSSYVVLMATLCALGTIREASASLPQNPGGQDSSSQVLVWDAPATRRQIQRNESQDYRVSLNQGQVAVLRLTQEQVDMVIEVYGPDGALLLTQDQVHGTQRIKEEHNPFEPVVEEAVFTAKTTGVHRIVVRPEAKQPGGFYRIVLWSAGKYTADKAAIESPRLRKLWEAASQEATSSSSSRAIGAFLAENKGNRGCLIEPIPGEDREVLMTLFYLGDGTTRAVTARPAPTPRGEILLDRFADTNLWAVSFRIPRDTFLDYGFSVRRAVPLSSERKTFPLVREDREDGAGWGLPDARPLLYLNEPAPGTPRGKLETRSVSSAVLKEERAYQVYTPPGYDPKSKRKYGVLVCFDGNEWVAGFPGYGDNIIAAKKVPPLIVVFVHHQETRSRDLACYKPFADFIANELLPAVRAAYPSATKDPRRTIVYGYSLGGLCAAYCGLTHPETFGNVLSLSGSFWVSPDWAKRFENSYAIPSEGSIPASYLQRKKLPLRFYMEVGTFEESDRQLMSNRQLRDILKAKGYTVDYTEFHGGHNAGGWIPGFATGLETLTREWR